MNDPYVAADPILMPWARRHGLAVDSIYKDDIVRSISVWTISNPEPTGQDAQLWITPPGERHDLEVHVAVGTWHHFIATDLSGLAGALDDEYAALLERGDILRKDMDEK